MSFAFCRRAARLAVWLALLSFSRVASAGSRDASDTADSAQSTAVAKAIAAKDYLGAYRALVAWHRTQRSPIILYWLGKLETAQGHVVEAQDLMRRYLAEAGDENQALAAEAHRVLGITRPPSAEVMILGPSGALVFVDERLMGALPLSTALLLPAGAKEVAIEVKQQRIGDRIRVMARRAAEVRFEIDSGLVVVSQGPALTVLPDYAERPPAVQQALQQGIEQASIQKRWAALPTEKLATTAPLCAADLSCLRNLATQQEVEHVLLVSAASDRMVTLTLVDTVVGEPIARREVSCGGCAPAAWTVAAKVGLTALLDEVIARGRGTVAVQSKPAGAALYLDGKNWGTTPLVRPYFGGSYELRARLAGYKNTVQQLTVRNAQKTTVELSMMPGKDEPIAPPQPQPRRRIAGALGVGAAVMLIGIGAALVAIDGSCAPLGVTSSCDSLYNTRAPGGVSIGVGLALGGVSVVLLATSH